MKILTAAGSILSGFAILGFGTIQFATQNFLTSLLPFPTLPLKSFWVNLTAVIFVVCGILLASRKLVAQSSALVGLLFSLFFLYPHLPRLIADPKDPRVWTVAFETLAIASGAWMISAAHNQDLLKVQKWMMPIRASSRISRFIFAVCLIVFGIQHFLYTDFIISLMPLWLPGKILFSYLIKFGFLLAALSLLLRIKVEWSMLLLGTMFLIWVIVLHAPRSITKLTDANEWASLHIALLLSGISFYISGKTYKSDNKVDPMN